MIVFGYDRVANGMFRQRVHVNDADQLVESWRARGLDVGSYREPEDPPTVDELLAGLEVTP